jgi:N-acetylmuramoyl-L-alanine amidase
MKICIDAGHGNTDSGAVGIGGRREKDDNLKMALDLQKRFKAIGWEVVMTRTADTYPTLTERCNIANNAKADVFISCHRNAFSDPNANGYEILHDPTASKKSIELAGEIAKRVGALGLKLRHGNGVVSQSATVLKHTKMPANTLEFGFVTNVADNKSFDSNFDKLMQCVVDGVLSVFGSASKPAPEPAGKTEKERIKEVQRIVGVTADGLIGKDTEKAIKKNMLMLKSPMMRGSFANWTQTRLKELGYDLGKAGVDSIYGHSTKDAVVSFQRKAGVTVDGIVGVNTVKALVK